LGSLIEASSLSDCGKIKYGEKNSSKNIGTYCKNDSMFVAISKE